MDKIVYALSHPTTDEVRYIGKSECGLKRPRQHGTLSNLKKTHLPVVRWIKKLRDHGLDYKIEVVEKCTTREQLMETECFYISYFRWLGFRLLNICDGGEGFTGHHTEEARAKIAAASRRPCSPETRAKISAARKGKALSEKHRAALRVPKSVTHPKSLETRQKISAAHKGKTTPPDVVLKVAKSRGARPFIDENGTIYQTQCEAARAYGIDQGSVRSVLIGKSRHAKGHTFSYLG